MDWKSKRIRTILEAALAEDKVANDVTTALTITPGLRASGTIVAKQACVVAGLGSIPVFLEIFSKMPGAPGGAVRSGEPSRDLRRREGEEGPDAGSDPA